MVQQAIPPSHFFWTMLVNRCAGIAVLVVIFGLLILGLLYFRSIPDQTGSVEVSDRCSQLFDEPIDYSSGDWDSSNHSDIHAILHKLDLPINTYLKVLRSSVSIVELLSSETPIACIAKHQCSASKKEEYLNHQHSLELRFPHALRQMQAAGAAANRPDLQFLWQEGDAQFSEPLFYYLETFQYFVVYCSYNARGPESWDKGHKYIQQASAYVMKHSYAWHQNMGMDFLAPASHPISGPIWASSYSLSGYERQTFMRVDFDVIGQSPRDIIVPYYTPWRSCQPSDNTRAHTGSDPAPHGQRNSTTAPPKLLLYFLGGNSPPGGVRSQLEKAIARLQKEDVSVAREVVFKTGRHLTSYEASLHHSTFCAHVRGDTASSSRLFQIIEAGCIPVVISDWLMLPFERVIDYSKFTLRFPESVVHDVRQLVADLRSIPPAQLDAMRQALRLAKGLLLFPPWLAPNTAFPAGAEFRILNPVTLTLVEMVMRRKEYCDNLNSSHIQHLRHRLNTSIPSNPSTYEGKNGNMCAKLYARLALARSS